MDNPTSAALSAGASLVPSPVAPTTSPTPPNALLEGWAFHSSRYPVTIILVIRFIESAETNLAVKCLSPYPNYVEDVIVPILLELQVMLFHLA